MTLRRDLAGMLLGHSPAQEQTWAYNEEIFGRPATKVRILVSSYMGRRNALHAEREAAAEAIESTGIAHAWLWERDAHAGP